MMPVATPARPARKPSAAQLRVLRRMANHGATLRLYAFCAMLNFADGERWFNVSLTTFDVMRNAGWIEPYPAMSPNHYRISDAGRKAAE